MVTQEAERNNIKMHDTWGVAYDESFTKLDKSKPKRDNDIFFYGGYCDRRQAFFNTFSLPIFHGMCDERIYQDELHRELAKSKILLNIHTYDCKNQYEIMRFILGISEKILIISETIEDSCPLIIGEHFLSLPLGEIQDACEYYLDRDDEREEIVNNAFDYLKINHSIDERVYNFLVANIDDTMERKNLEVEFPKVIHYVK